jgi:ornithine lipid hydroxylase
LRARCSGRPSQESKMKHRSQSSVSSPKRFVQNNLYIVFTAISLAAFTLALHLKLNLEITLLAVSIVLLVTIVVLERWLPHQASWQIPHDDTRTDCASAIVLIGLIDPALKATLPLVAIYLLSALPGPAASASVPFGTTRWEAIGFWPAVMVALLFSEFAKYWAHRMHHHLQPLWWLHAMHHSSMRLYWLNGFRFHPLNYAINTALSVLPLWLVGTPVDVMLAVQACTQPIIFLQHANIDLRSGWLNQVLSTNEVHRAHHSKRAGVANSNYGNALVIWDKLFSTYQPARAPGTLIEIGLFESSKTYPATQSYWRQLQSMFTPVCCKRSS